MTQELVTYQPDSRAVTTDIADEMDVDKMERAVANFHEFVSRILKPGIHYGTVPGVKKPFLWQPGAEEIFRGFNCRPDYSTVKETIDPVAGYAMVWRKCQAVQIDTGLVVGEADAICVSTEFTKKDGTPLPFYDTLPKALMMADKRAFVKAARTLGCASEFFTQDEEAVARQQAQDSGEEPTQAPPEYGEGWRRTGDKWFIDCPTHGKDSFAKFWPKSDRGSANVSCSKKNDDGTWCKTRKYLNETPPPQRPLRDRINPPVPPPGPDPIAPLREAFDNRIVTPGEVAEVLGEPATPGAVRRWLAADNSRHVGQLVEGALAMRGQPQQDEEPEWVEGEITEDDKPF